MSRHDLRGKPYDTVLKELEMIVATQPAEGFREVGAKVTVGDMEFTAVECRPYVRRDGSPSQIVTWRSHCAACGESYEVKGSRNPAHVSKNCHVHRGTRSPSVRGRRAATELKWARRIIKETDAALATGQIEKARQLLGGHQKIWSARP